MRLFMNSNRFISVAVLALALAGSLAWAGIFNTFFWIDPKQSTCAVLMMQFLPFVDPEAMGLLGDFERAVYSTLRPPA